MNITIRVGIIIPLLLLGGCDTQTSTPKPSSPHAADRPSPPLAFSNNTEWVKSVDGILQFRIGTDAKVYGREDNIYVSLELKNISDNMTLVEPISGFPFGSTDQLTFTGPNGAVKYVGAYKSMSPPHPIPLAAGASISEVVQLVSFEGLNVSGGYSIKYRYVCYDHFSTTHCWKGDILSAFASFTRTQTSQAASAGDVATRAAPEK